MLREVLPDSLTVDTDLEWARIIRNHVREFMTNNTDSISREEQIEWFREIDHNKLRLFLIEEKYPPIPVGYGIINKSHTPFPLLTGAIIPSHQGRGYGKELFQGLIDLCEDDLAPELDVRSDNIRAIKLYESLGFVKTVEYKDIISMKAKMKFLIVLMYCDRPNMVQFALDSIRAQTYRNFNVAVVDDSARTPGGDFFPDNSIVRYMKDPALEGADPNSAYTVSDTIEEKTANGGSRFGLFVNQAINESDADIGLMLCDDDALLPNTLHDLNEYYIHNPHTSYSYGHVLTYNPYDAPNYSGIKGRYGSSLNNYDQPINAFCRVDASQVSWRMDAYKNAGIQFPHPQTAALDAIVYQQMYDMMGFCHFNGKFVQYKGVFPDQLGTRKDPYRPVDKEFYDTAI